MIIEPIQADNLIGLRYALNPLESVSAGTCFVFSYFSYFGVISIVISLISSLMTIAS